MHSILSESHFTLLQSDLQIQVVKISLLQFTIFQNSLDGNN